MKVFLTFLLAWIAILGLVPGCKALNPSPPIEAFANKLADEAVLPAIKAGIEQGIRSFAVQAGAQGINPTYAIEFEGKWVVGLEGKATVGVEGIAGQFQMHTTGDEETDKSPSQGGNPPPRIIVLPPAPPDEPPGDAPPPEPAPGGGAA